MTETVGALIAGAFDLGHWGHIRFLKQAAVFGPVTVALSSDRFLEETKRKPMVGFDDRKRWLEELGATVVIRDTMDLTKVAVNVSPKFFVCGNDWLYTDHLETMGLDEGFLNRRDMAVVYLPREHNMSTSKVVEAIV